jgi:hypothetical protein
MRLFQLPTALALALLCAVGTATAQRHDVGSSPPTAPPPKPVPAPVVAISSGMGALQFTTANLGISAPQSLVRQLLTSDERTRLTALSAIGAPAQYLNHGHVAVPHSLHLDFVALGNTDELDAILTVELDQHLLSAILDPEDGEWHRVATVLYPTPFADPSTNPSTFAQTTRSLLEPRRYAAVFHATTNGPNGDLTENEAHLRILNDHAVITLSFASTERVCDPTHQHPCEFTERWLQPDTTDPEHRFLLVTASGRVRPNEPSDPIARAETFETAHLRTFLCQPFAFSDASQHFEPTANPTPCIAPRDPAHDQPLH